MVCIAVVSLQDWENHRASRRVCFHRTKRPTAIGQWRKSKLLAYTERFAVIFVLAVGLICWHWIDSVIRLSWSEQNYAARMHARVSCCFVIEFINLIDYYYLQTKIMAGRNFAWRTMRWIHWTCDLCDCALISYVFLLSASLDRRRRLVVIY